jgi:hypothetical protein
MPISALESWTARSAECSRRNVPNGWIAVAAVLGLSFVASCKAQSGAKGSAASSAPVSAASSAAPSPAPEPSGDPRKSPRLKAMLDDDPGRCVKRVLVGGEGICFEFNRDYYWCRGNAAGEYSIGPAQETPPYYRVLPYRYDRLFLGRNMGCGRNAGSPVECWGLANQSFPSLNANPAGIVTPSPLDDFSMWGGYLCARSGDAVSCVDSSTRFEKVRNLGTTHLLGTGALWGCAAGQDKLWCWGRSEKWIDFVAPEENGQLELNAAAVVLPRGTRIRSLHVASVHACVLTEDGAVYCFGNPLFGTWGNGQHLECDTPEDPGCTGARQGHHVKTLGHDVREMAAGGGFNCALKKDGTVWCWGNNQDHVVGPRAIVTPRSSGNYVVEPLPLQRSEVGSDNRALAVGMSHACVEKNDGALWCWGGNAEGQIANERGESVAPRPIPLPAQRCTAH